MSTSTPEPELPLVPVLPPPPPSLQADELTVEEVLRQFDKTQELTRRAMKLGEDYGQIPGTAGKPTLLQPGAQKLSFLYQLWPDYEPVKEVYDGDHYTVMMRCRLIHIPTGRVRGTKLAICSTKEARYAFRKAERTCPKCGASAIRKGHEKYGGGWFCSRREGGCGATYKETDSQIVNQPMGRVPNPNLYDLHHTVAMMAQKRAFVGAMLTATAAGHLFTQDVEDLGEDGEKAALRKNGAPARHETPEEAEITRTPDREVMDIAEFAEWLTTLQHVRSVKSAQEVWKQIQAPDVWTRFTPTEQAELVKAKDAAKIRVATSEVA